MAMLDFLNKKKEEVSTSPIAKTFTPKVVPARGPGGKFISKKKTEEVKTETASVEEVSHESPKKKSEPSQVKGPFMAPFAGKEIRKFYTNGKWYFSLEDLIFLLFSDPAIPPLTELKDNKEFKEILKSNIAVINEVDCTDCKASVEILREIIKAYNADFPGSLFRWLEDISTNKLELASNEERK